MKIYGLTYGNIRVSKGKKILARTNVRKEVEMKDIKNVIIELKKERELLFTLDLPIDQLIRRNNELNDEIRNYENLLFAIVK